MRYLKVFFFALLCLGFRTYYSENKWQGISNASSASRKIFFTYPNGTQTVPNDLDSSDPLGSSGATVTVDQLMQAIFDDYSNIAAAYITLVSTSDSDYQSGSSPTVTIRFEGASGGNTGQAEFEMSGDHIVGCSIEAEEDVLNSAKEFTRVIAHEIGHCLGLDHPQESVNSIMSYFGDPDIVRLQIDDKMGITYLYPVNPSAAKEDSTFGLKCAKR